MTNSTIRPKPEARAEGPQRAPASEFEASWRYPERSLVDYMSALWTRKYLVVAVAGATTFAATIFALTQPNVYVSTASLLVTGSRSGANAAEVAANMLRVGNIGPSQVLSALEVVNSNHVAERVVENLGPAMITKPYEPERAGSEEREKMGVVDIITDTMHRAQASWFAQAATETATRVDVATEVFKRSFVAWADERASMIKISYRAGSKLQAQQVLNEVVKVAVDRYREVTAPPERMEFMQQNLEPAERRYEATKAAYDEFISTHGRVRFSEEIVLRERQLAEIAASLESRKRDRGTTAENLANWETWLKDAENRPWIEAKVMVTQDDDRLRDSLIESRVDLDLRRIKLEAEGESKKDSAEYKGIMGSLEHLRSELAALERPRQVLRVVENRDYTAIEAQARLGRIRLAELEAELPKLEADVNESRTELNALRRLNEEGERLAETYTKAKAEYESLRNTRGTFEIESQLKSLGLNSLQPVDHPNLPLVKEGPRRGRVILAGLAAGLMACMTLILLMVRVGKTFLRASEVTVSLGRSDVVGLPWLDRGNVRRFRMARRRGWD